jgi:hypothetical protein
MFVLARPLKPSPPFVGESGPNVIKLFCPLFTNFCNVLVFVPGKLFQPSATNTLA